MTPEELRRAFAVVGAWIGAYYDNPRRFPVRSSYEPGELRDRLPLRAPEAPEPFDDIFADFQRLIVPGITHWNHPRFFAYFAISADPSTVLAEALAATLDVNAMVWRTSPAATELEEVVVRWLREELGLPAAFEGVVYDTASIAGFTALAAARESLDLDIRERGMAGRADLPALRVYITEHTHSHIEKGAIALGIGRENVIKVPVDDAFAMRPDALDALLREDIAAGRRPMCVGATVGTTSTTSSDPVEAVARVAKEHGVWLHVDAAYAGPAAILPEFRWLLDPAHGADSIVVNPHKWLFVPVDFSVLYVRDMELLRRTFSLAAVYLVTADAARNYMDYGLQLGRRFRALKMWFAFRSLGVDAMRSALRGHIALAQKFAAWVKETPEWEVMAPHPLSVVCFRHHPSGMNDDEIDAHNLALVERANASGEIFVSTTSLHGHIAIRLAIGNQRTTPDDVAVAWDVLKRACASS